MATTITSECINCGACEPECPNTAIYGGGVSWELNGETRPAIAQDIYYIVPAKCTECVGFYDHEACAAVCPVDCCIPDPANLESEQVLIERAKVLHPEESFGADFPSRFRKEGAGAAPASAANGAAASAPDGGASPAAEPAAKPRPALPPPVAAAAAPARSDEFDPIAWEVPIRCKDCNEVYNIPYRYFQVGVVFNCPFCSGSFVPTSYIYRTVKDTFEGFYLARQREQEAHARKRAREQQQFEAKQVAEMNAFRERLRKLADEIKPAGKTVKPKGLASMFT